MNALSVKFPSSQQVIAGGQGKGLTLRHWQLAQPPLEVPCRRSDFFLFHCLLAGFQSARPTMKQGKPDTPKRNDSLIHGSVLLGGWCFHDMVYVLVFVVTQKVARRKH